MAQKNRVEALMKGELTARASAKMASAGDTWRVQTMGFFFPGNEDTVDLAALAVLDRVLGEDGTTIPSNVRNDVATLIGTATPVRDAIRIIFVATAQPEGV